MTDVAVVILNYNTFQMTLDTISEIRNQEYDGNVTIIVVDNKSPNESAKILEENAHKLGYIFIESENNNGYAAGNNIGIKHSCSLKKAYTFVMNNDVKLPDKNTFEKMVRFMEKHREIGAASPRIIGIDGKKDKPIYYKKPSMWDLTFGMISYNRGRSLFDDERNCGVYAPRGSFMILRNSAVDEADYMDESTFLYYEEPILAERLAKNGYKVAHLGDTHVIHAHAATIKTEVQKKKGLRILCESYRIYLSKYRHFGNLLVKCCLIIRYLAASRRS